MDTDHILLEQFINNHPLIAAQVIERLKDEDVVDVVTELPIDLSIAIINKINSYKLARCFELLSPDFAVEIIEKMELQLAEQVLRQCEMTFRETLLKGVSSNLSNLLRKNLKHSDNSIESMMKPITFSVRKEMTVDDAIAIVKQENKQMASVIPVVDSDGKPEGIIRLYELFLLEGTDELDSILKKDVPKFKTDMPIELAAKHPAWYEFQSIPVIDNSNKLIGMLDFETFGGNKTKKTQKPEDNIVEAGNSLGELYRLGLTGFLQSISK